MYEEMQKELCVDDKEESEVVIKEEKVIPVKKFNVKKNKMNCPECGEPLTAIGGCVQCNSCAYSRCD
jgi:ribonucleoside-diphosphate reductase alpha chain